MFRPGWFYNEPQDHIDPMERDLALPVRRPGGKDRSAVFAVPTEIDLWLRSRPARSPYRQKSHPERCCRQTDLKMLRLVLD